MNFNMSQFDFYREDNRREVKKAKGGLPVSLWETYSAFANCYGGVIILGVKENKDGSWFMTGLENAKNLRKDFWDTINNKNNTSKVITKKEPPERTAFIIPRTRAAASERGQARNYQTGHFCRSVGASCRRPFPAPL